MRSFWKVSSYFLTIFFIAFGIYYLYENNNIYQKISDFPQNILLLLIIFYALFFLINALILRVSISGCQATPGVLPLAGITVLSSLSNYVVPFRAAGLSIKAIFLKKEYGISMSHFAGIFALSSFIVIIINTIIGIIFSHFLWPSSNNILLFFYFCLIVSFLMIIFLKKILQFFLKSDNRITTWLTNIQSGLNSININLFLKLCILNIIQITISSVILFLLLTGVEQKISFYACFILSIIGNLSLVISITPSNIGVKELFFALIANHFSISQTDMVSALLVDRLIQVSFLIFSSALFICFYKKINKNKPPIS